MNYLKYHVSGNKRLESLNLYVIIVISGGKDFVFSGYYDVINNSVIIIIISWVLFNYI
jgi:hypothetical protein